MTWMFLRRVIVGLAMAGVSMGFALAYDNEAAVGAAQRPANIGIIPIGSNLRFAGNNAPDTYSDMVTFGTGPVLVDSGKVRIWQEQVATGSNGEWEIFHMQVVNGGPLANNQGANWSIVMDYTLSLPVVFDQAVDQWAVNGVPFSPLSNIGDICCASTLNPILPGAAYYNTFSVSLPAGPQTNWRQIFVNPYSFAASGGINTATANEFTFGLHFTLRPAAAPSISAVISASAFGAFPSFAPGSWIEIYGSNFSVGNQTWATGDFNGVNAPTALGGTTVTVGGRAAYVSFISPGQINVQVPAGVTAGAQFLIVTTPAGATAPFSVTVENTKPGLLAPPPFKINATQYAVALFSDFKTYVLPPGAIAGITSRRARPGETITFFGVGFGPVNPNVPPGQLSQISNTLATPVSVTFGSSPATVTYQGLAPNFVGLYQFNVVVPNIASNDAVPLTFNLGGVNIAQNLSIAVGN